MKTLLEKEIPENIRGIVYLCHFDYQSLTLTVQKEIQCQESFVALTLYAEIPNPESQLVMGGTYDELIKELELLHKNMLDPKWLKELANSL
jgi:hypothetical protein